MVLFKCNVQWVSWKSRIKDRGFIIQFCFLAVMLFEKFMLSQAKRTVSLTVGKPGGRGVLKKVLYGKALPRGPTPYPFIYLFFFRKGTPFVNLLLEKGTPFMYLLKVIPQYCTAHLLLRTISHVISARALENGGFFFTARPRQRSKSSFLRKRVW